VKELIRMKYGAFSKDGKEFIIRNPNPPRAWVNYLFNNKYHAIVSQTGGGFSYYLDPKYNRVLRYDYVNSDRPGRYVYVHDVDTRSYWSLTYQPIQKTSGYTCTHGIGYTTIASKTAGIESEVKYFVPLNDPVEIWQVTLKNPGRKTRRLRVFPYAEFVGGDVSMEQTLRMITTLYNTARYNSSAKTLLFSKKMYSGRIAMSQSFMTATQSPKKICCVKDIFLGRYNDCQKPQSVIHGECPNVTASDGDEMAGAFQFDITLPAGATKTFAVVVGCTDNAAQALKIAKKFQSMSTIKKEYSAMLKYWDTQINRIMVDTPDKKFNTMVNYWGKYQLFAITQWRGTSHYHGGDGGQGYRDTAQDVEGLLSTNLPIAKEKLEKLLYFQYNTGHAVSGWSDIEGPWENTGAGGVGGKSDVAVWLPFAVVSYVKETGDKAFLKKKIPYHNGGSDTVYNHIIKAVTYIYKKSGKRGLPLIGHADWNDAYDSIGAKGKGESVWLAMAVVRAAKTIRELSDYLKDSKTARAMKRIIDDLTGRINKTAWDGKWYLAAFSDNGTKVGSAKNKEGKHPLNSQTWAILSGTVTDKRLPDCLNVIDKKLATAWGPMLCDAYTKYNPNIGRVSSFAPGTKENGSVFSHAVAFKVVADCLIKRGNKAYESFSKLLPCSDWKWDNIEKFKVEPYVYSEFVVGPSSKLHAGEGSFTWNTGTTPWMWIAATEFMLGARREFDGLRIDPCIPDHWKKARIKRTFRNDIYDISIRNPKGKQSGVVEIKVDGKRISGTLIKPFGDKKTHIVEVLMG